MPHGYRDPSQLVGEAAARFSQQPWDYFQTRHSCLGPKSLHLRRDPDYLTPDSQPFAGTWSHLSAAVEDSLVASTWDTFRLQGRGTDRAPPPKGAAIPFVRDLGLDTSSIRRENTHGD